MKYGWPLGHARARVGREGEELKRRRRRRRRRGEEKREQRRGGKKRDFKIFKRV